ncbi:hypothetical protein SAMN05421821_10251 [Mucilaginibacter lappiensis]|uniref:Uncharacterized protein n=1 Tax=Mucilaginibacter lappiensis TaxID=354630 RepID=A0ABR6PG35_9SPHI|nr:hypothetical protein [Mucilaginibacter lappiensis]SIQ26812.1 hypothetical protein SAMN05421821_10251 [Mucilaginibacter lappiensis]
MIFCNDLKAVLACSDLVNDSMKCVQSNVVIVGNQKKESDI